MTPQPHDLSWLDASETISVSDLSRVCGISTDELNELVEYGALRPSPMGSPGRVFSAAYVAPLRTACKLRRDYDLELFTVALLMEYLNRIEDLEHELRTLQAKTPAHVIRPQREGPQPWREQHAKSGSGEE
jgi:chaperone modulatory protein CbpM